MIYGKIPPQAVEIEKVILGICMLERDAIHTVSEMITEACFYSDAHRAVFKAIIALKNSGRPIDIHTVSSQLRASDELEIVGGEYYVTQLTNFVVSSANTPEHCRLVLQAWMKREIIRVAGELMTKGYEDGYDPFQILDEAEKVLVTVRNQVEQNSYKPLTTVLIETFKHLEKIRHRVDHLTGITSGFIELDRVTCGWQDTDLIILAARPSVGKTAFALNLAMNASKSVPVGFFSLEMSDRQLVQRVLSGESGILLWNLRNGKMDDQEMKELYVKGIQPLADRRIFIDDTANIRLDELKSKARRMALKDGVKIVFIDYLQLITTGQQFSRKDLEIGFISSQLKGLAKELSLPIICLSQLSRDVEKRGGDGEPKLSDLRDGGAIEQDADMVLFLWRPNEAEIQENAELTGFCHVKIDKHRNGTLEKFLGKFNKDIQKWEYLKVLDHSGIPMGQNWRPVTIN